MVPLRASTTKSESLPDDPTAFAPSTLWKLPCITTWADSQSQNHPTNSAEEAQIDDSGGPRRVVKIGSVPSESVLEARCVRGGDLGSSSGFAVIPPERQAAQCSLDRSHCRLNSASPL